MSYVPLEKLLKDKQDSVYKLAVLASRRAIALSQGAQRLVDVGAAKLSTIALEEIAAGKVRYKVREK